MLHAHTPAEIEELIERRVSLMFSKGLTVQPYIIIVGSSLSNVAASYVVVNNYTYKTVSLCDAIDFCFKVYHVLDFKYPFECQHIWHLIQVSLYGIQTKSDLKIPFIQDLINIES